MALRLAFEICWLSTRDEALGGENTSNLHESGALHETDHEGAARGTYEAAQRHGEAGGGFVRHDADRVDVGWARGKVRYEHVRLDDQPAQWVLI